MSLLALVLATVSGTALAAAPAVQERPLGQVVQWNTDKDGQRALYRIGPYQLDLHAIESPAGDMGGLAPQLTIDPDGLHSFAVTGVAAWPGRTIASFMVARLDPRALSPSIVMTSFSGGAHCCMQVQIATPARYGWLVADMGRFDNEPLYEPPRDFDGDGAVEIIVRDDRFAYRFDSYGGSYQPIRVFGVRDGVVVERSLEPGFRPLLEGDMRKAGALCRDHQSGACAAYVADAARIGRFAEAWPVMLAAITPNFQFPNTACDGRLIHLTCPSGHEQPVADYPTALRRFLAETGYPVPAGPGTSGG